ncbi:MAG TPA: plastocyanin/azurin family copper-binding protein [Solirubrobacteraceae bacterium]|nr:plastocyanin/azurin family copper-binding protein [Solirubrobacteraceae bacterium]
MSDTASTRRSRRRLYPTIGLGLVALAVPVAGVTAVAGAAGSKTVALKNIAFAPKSLSVSKGTRVTFAFRDDGTTHNVTSTASTRFKTISDRETGSPSRTFERAGTYSYHCTLHPGMTGRITVR